MNKKLYVGNLSYAVTDEQLQQHFSQAGVVVSAAVIRFADSGRSKGFGFVEMETEEGAQNAISMFNEQEWEGRNLIVNEARPPKPRTSFGGGGRDDRGGRSSYRGGGGGGGYGRNDGYDA